MKDSNATWSCGIAGLASGCLAYAKAHIFLLDIHGSDIISLLWAGFVALFTGAMGALGHIGVKKFFNRKNKPNEKILEQSKRD